MPFKNSSTSRVTGTPRAQNGRFVLTDETTKVTMELNGQGVEKELGQRIEVTGSIDTLGRPAAEASQVMNVTQMARLFKKNNDANDSNNAKSKQKGAADGSSDSSSSGSAAGKGNGSAAPAGVGGAAAGAAIGGILGLSTTTVAIVGGVAAASTLGGLAAADKLPGQSTTATSSR